MHGKQSEGNVRYETSQRTSFKCSEKEISDIHDEISIPLIAKLRLKHLKFSDICWEKGELFKSHPKSLSYCIQFNNSLSINLASDALLDSVEGK